MGRGPDLVVGIFVVFEIDSECFCMFLLLIFKRGTFCGRRFTVVHELTGVPPLLRPLFRRITSLLSTVS